MFVAAFSNYLQMQMERLLKGICLIIFVVFMGVKLGLSQKRKHSLGIF
jgi:hypothetical protein